MSALPGDAFVAQGCPKCGGPLVIRSQRQSGRTFAGCRAYPRCKGTISFPNLRPPAHSIIRGGATKARAPD